MVCYLVCAMEATRGQWCLTPVLGHLLTDLSWPRAVRAEISLPSGYDSFGRQLYVLFCRNLAKSLKSYTSYSTVPVKSVELFF